mmetsp:Transcript_104060/g.291559  ORF Transcript_104060/g.291559 Transcript_104060/m.291559 type:complete len:364 (+) Transcript_104060:206-1297(+)
MALRSSRSCYGRDRERHGQPQRAQHGQQGCKDDHAAGLVRDAKLDGHVEEERCDAQAHLPPHGEGQQPHHCRGARREGLRGGVGGQGQRAAHGRVGQASVVELHHGRLLEEVPPLRHRHRHCAEPLGRNPIVDHLRPCVVGAARVVARDEGAADERQRDDARRRQGETPAPQSGGRCLRCLVHGLRAGAQQRERIPHTAAIQRQRRRPMRCEPVGRHPRPLVGAQRRRVLLRGVEAAAHHPPTHEGLREAQAEEPRQAEGELRAEDAPNDEVREGQGEVDARAAPPHAVEPLHEVDPLELLELHLAGMQALVLGVALVLLKLLLPSLLCQRQAPPLDPPVRHREPAAAEAGVAAEGDHGEEHA